MLTPQDRDIVTRTLLGEALGEGADGMRAVAHVIANRVASGAFGSSPSQVALAKNQFSAWNKGKGGNNLVYAYGPNTPEYKKAAAIADTVFAGADPDPTGGATYYVNPRGTKWRPPGQETATIGRHVFYGNGPVPPLNVGETAQGRQMPLGMGRGRISSGPAVRDLQQQLAESGYDPGPVDSIYGPRTAAAVRSLEAAQGLTRDRGIAGPQVQTALGNAGMMRDALAYSLAPGGPPSPEVGYPGAGQPLSPPPSQIATAPHSLGPYITGAPGRTGLPAQPTTFPTADKGAYPTEGIDNLAHMAAFDQLVRLQPQIADFSGVPIGRMGYPGAGQPLPGAGRDFNSPEYGFSDFKQPARPITPTPSFMDRLDISNREFGSGLADFIGGGLGSAWNWLTGGAAGGPSPVEAGPIGSQVPQSQTPFAMPQPWNGAGDANTLDQAKQWLQNRAGGPQSFNGSGSTDFLPGGPASDAISVPTVAGHLSDMGIIPQATAAPMLQAPSIAPPTQPLMTKQGGASPGGTQGGRWGDYSGSRSNAVYSASLPYAANPLGGFTMPNGGYSNSPFTPAGWTAPSFNPISGGPSYAYQPNGYGGGTYVTSDGRVMSY